MDFPDQFNSHEDKILYLEMFEKHLDLYHDLLCLVLYKIYGPKFSFSSLDGKTLSLIYEITTSISYVTNEHICRIKPEYKTEGHLLYSPKETLKEVVAEAVKQAMEENQNGL